MAEQVQNRRMTTRLVAAGVMAVAAVAIYVTIDGQRNTADAACTATAERAAVIDDHAVGQLAGFRNVGESQLLSDIEFLNADGETVSIGDFSGQLVLLNFWATWCGPCREEMPALNQLEAELGGEGFKVVAVSLDTNDTPEGPRDFFDEHALTELDLYLDPTAGITSRMRSMGLLGGLPTTMLIDEGGCSLGVIEGPAEWAGPDAIGLIEAALEPPA